MAEPLSITTGILSLISTIGKTSLAVADFVKTCREARRDLLEVSQELLQLEKILEWLKDDTEESSTSIPETLTAQILPIISNCSLVLDRIQGVVGKHSGRFGPTRWAIDGKKDVTSLRGELAAHRGALNVTLEAITITIARGIKDDTVAIRDDTAELKFGQEQIFAKIIELQSQLPQEMRENSSTTFVIQRYLDSLTSYAETVTDGLDHRPENTSVGSSRESSPPRPRNSAESDRLATEEVVLPSPNNSSDVSKTPKERSRTTILTATGIWDIRRTIGQGKIGKVKLVRRVEGGIQAACKIIPRSGYGDEASNIARKVQTAREVAVIILFDHPYIYCMRHCVRTKYNWYLLLELVDGGTLDEYLHSHKNKINEKLARKLSRQILSALDYCHRNSIVHLDLCLQNIMIFKSGDIKIIDFGDANLCSAKELLTTHREVSSFVAPEIQKGKPYDGRKADLWSFGVVLYTLLVGNTPYDEDLRELQNMNGVLGLSLNSTDLLSKNLKKDPEERTTLTTVLNHSWLLSGYAVPPESYIPYRKPLSLPLDLVVIRAMTGFNFGTSQQIHDQLIQIVASEDYQQGILRLHENQRITEEWHTAMSKARKERKLGFIKKVFTANTTDQTSGPSDPPPVTRQTGLDGVDIMDAFHPLVSVYYLVREKQDRTRRASLFRSKTD